MIYAFPSILSYYFVDVADVYKIASFSDIKTINFNVDNLSLPCCYIPL